MIIEKEIPPNLWNTKMKVGKKKQYKKKNSYRVDLLVKLKPSLINLVLESNPLVRMVLDRTQCPNVKSISKTF